MPATWGFFAERLPRLTPNDSRRVFKDLVRAAVARLANATGELELVADHPQGEIRLRCFQRESGWMNPHLGGPPSSAFGITEKVVAATLHHERQQLRGDSEGRPAIVAIAGGMGESIEDIDIALFGRTWERHDESERPVEFGFDPSGIWGKLRGGESVLAALLVFCKWQWTTGNDPVLYVNPRFRGALPHALDVLHRREVGENAITAVDPRFSGLFAVLRGAAGLAP